MDGVLRHFEHSYSGYIMLMPEIVLSLLVRPENTGLGRNLWD